MTEDRNRRLDRLSDAIDAYLDHRRGTSGDAESFLESHSNLRDLLEPMVAAESAPADSRSKWA